MLFEFSGDVEGLPTRLSLDYSAFEKYLFTYAFTKFI